MRSRSSAILSVACGLALLALLLLALGGTAGRTEAAAPGSPERGRVHSPQAAASNGASSRPLVVALGTDPPTLDVNLATDTTSHMVLDQLMEALYRYRVDGSVEPAGAITHTVSSDGRVYTVTLRSDARWSDGQVITAQHYVDGIIRLLDPDLGAEYAVVMYRLEGAEEYNTGVITDSNAVGVRTVATDTLVFTLKEPAAFFPSIMAMCTTYPVRLDIINSDPNWTEGGHFVGNGAYVLTEWDHDNRLVLDKNPLYHSAAQVAIGQVIFPIIPNYDDRLAAYQNDQLDVLGGPDFDQIQSDPVLSAEFHQTPRPGVYYLDLNTQLTPTNNVSVCKALASAIDRQYIITDVVNRPWLEDVTGAIPPGIPGYQGRAVGYTFNLTQAQAYLAQAGYPGGVGLPAIELWYNSADYNELVVEAVAEQWRDNLGITVTTFYTDWDLYLDYLDGCHEDPGTCDYNAYRMGWVMDYGDANNILNDVFHPDSSFHYTGWDNARYRQLIGMTLTETDQVSRTAYFQEADRILVEEEAVVIPIHSYDRSTLVKSDVIFEYPSLGSPRYMNWRIATVLTETITSTGGTVSSPDGDIEVKFPEDAVSDTVIVTYTTFFLPPHPPSGTFAFAGNGFILEVADVSSGEEITTFFKPLTVTIEYTDGDLNGQDEDTLELMYWNGDAWVTDGITIVEQDTVDNRLVALIEHLTAFGLFGQYDVRFEIGKVYESSRVAGTLVTYTLTITNTGINTATGVIVSDTIPAYLTDVITEGGTLQPPFVWWQLDSIAPDGGTATTGFRATLPCTAGRSIVNDDYGVRWSDQGVSGTVGAPVTFTVLAPTLSPAFDQSATEVDPGETVTFTDTSTTNGTPIFARAWGLGGGVTASGPRVSHTYTQTGGFTVTLTVTGTCGFSDWTVVRDAVIVRPPTNTPPTVDGLPDQLFDHTTSLPGVIDLWSYVSDDESDLSELTCTIEGPPPTGAGVTLVSNQYVIVDPSPNWCGGTDVTIRCTDPGGLWDEDIFRVALSWSCPGPVGMPGAPVLVAPVDGRTTHSDAPTFAWHEVGGAEGYQIQVDDVDKGHPADFARPEWDETTSVTEFALPSRLSDGTYTWRVWAVKGSELGDWSEGWAFTMGAPSPAEHKLYLPVVERNSSLLR